MLRNYARLSAAEQPAPFAATSQMVKASPPRSHEHTWSCAWGPRCSRELRHVALKPSQIGHSQRVFNQKALFAC